MFGFLALPPKRSQPNGVPHSGFFVISAFSAVDSLCHRLVTQSRATPGITVLKRKPARQPPAGRSAASSGLRFVFSFFIIDLARAFIWESYQIGRQCQLYAWHVFSWHGILARYLVIIEISQTVHKIGETEIARSEAATSSLFLRKPL